MQMLIEKFIVGKYNQQLFSNSNFDQISEKLGWDRQQILAYFTKVLAQKRYMSLHGPHEGAAVGTKQSSSNAMERLRQDPERYLSQMDGQIFEKPPDLSIMEDNQIIDVVVEKAIRDIQNLCD